MRAFLTLWRRELAAYFLSPIAYVVVIFFLIVMGFSFWMLANVLSQGVTAAGVMTELFASIFFWIAILVVVPVITMRLFAEEMRSGTIETLMTAPVTDVTVVLAKYAGAAAFYVLMWLPTVSYAFILKAFAPLMAPVDLGPMITSYLGALVVGLFFISIGLLASSLTRNQIVAAITCFAATCMIFFLSFLPYIARTREVRDVGRYISLVGHMLDFSRGVVDTRPIVFCLTCTLFMLFATVKVVESRRWK